ncbi:MAG: DEAD/DEAH box helicase [Syntrophaceae bacterium]|nr:DEAD/DEAH box helicase [Syntrophaceae bacterium]
MNFGRFEWLTILREPEPAVHLANVGPSVAYHTLTCPTCGWVDGDKRFENLAGRTEHRECWRCGARWGLPDEIRSFFSEEGISLPTVQIDFSNDNSNRLYRSDASLSSRFFELFMKISSLRLREGYDELISLTASSIDRFPHQIRTVRTVLEKMRGRAIIADEVGLGKTIEASLVMKELLLRGMARHILILTPAALVKQWQEELKSKFNEGFKTFQTRRLADDIPLRLICSYDTAKRRPVLLERIWDILILDEAHRLKNRNTAISKFVRKIKSSHVLGLSATPIENSLSDIWNLVDIVSPGRLGTVRTFRRNYAGSGRYPSVKEGSNPALRLALSDVMIRNRRDACGLQIPRRRAGIYYLSPSDAEKNLYTELSHFVKKEFKEIVLKHSPNQFHMLNLVILQRELMSSPRAVSRTLRKMAHRKEYPRDIQRRLQGFAEMAAGIQNPVKMKALTEMMGRYPGKQFVIFTEFVSTMEAITEILSGRGMIVFTLFGRLSSLQRSRVLSSFRNTPAAILVSTEAGSTGYNLQHCHHLINFDLPWNPMKVEQRIGRIDRIGQKEETLIINMVCRETIEEHVVNILAHKLRIFEMVVGETATILGNLKQARSFEQSITDIWLGSESDEAEEEAFMRLGDTIVASRESYKKSERASRQLDYIGA